MSGSDSELSDSELLQFDDGETIGAYDGWYWSEGRWWKEWTNYDAEWREPEEPKWNYGSDDSDQEEFGQKVVRGETRRATSRKNKEKAKKKHPNRRVH